VVHRRLGRAAVRGAAADRVHVDVDRVRVELEAADAGLLGCLPEGCLGQACVAVLAVAAELHPLADAAVQAEQHAAVRTDDQGTGGDVAGPVSARHGDRTRGQQLQGAPAGVLRLR
jgi:hypothetical protein